MVTDTKPLEKCCSRCKNIKTEDKFIPKRNICKECRNKTSREKYKVLEINENEEQECNICKNQKPITSFIKNRRICKDCERDEPLEKMKRVIRSRIISALKNKNKHTIEYLGCNTPEYLKWLLKNDSGYTLENRGKEWHIDHVIPLSHFDLENEEQQLIAFNWRNTMPLSCQENLKKNNKIIKLQIEQHYKKLVEYHLENKLDLPQVYIDLFVKYLVAGSPLEPI